jgi:CheY-like chemotaxis protein
MDTITTPTGLMPQGHRGVSGAAEGQENRSPKRAAERLAGSRILVVDDNVDAADSLSALLELLGADVRTVHGGAAALQLLETFEADLVLLDIGMPVLDGYEVARRIRAHPRLHDVYLVAVTGWGQAQDRQRSTEAGFDEHLVKPVELDAILGLGCLR